MIGFFKTPIVLIFIITLVFVVSSFALPKSIPKPVEEKGYEFRACSFLCSFDTTGVFRLKLNDELFSEVIPGDVNVSGDITKADYTAWVNLAYMLKALDANLDGVIDSLDLAAIRDKIL